MQNFAPMAKNSQKWFFSHRFFQGGGLTGYEVELRCHVRQHSQKKDGTCCISYCWAWCLVFEKVCYFILVAMVTEKGLWLAKHENKRNCLTINRTHTILGWEIYWFNTQWTMKPDFWYGCHGNQESTNQVILNHNSNLKIQIQNRASWFTRSTCTYYLCQISCLYDVSFLSSVRSRIASLRISTKKDISR